MEQRKKALIVGMAKSGIGAAKLLSQSGWDVIINDKKTEIAGLSEALDGISVDWRLGEEPQTLFDGVSLIVISPIIPMTVPFVRAAKSGESRSSARSNSAIGLATRSLSASPEPTARRPAPR